jgi:hypothetical protein
MALAAKKQKADTEQLRAEALAALQSIDTEIAELDAQRLERDPGECVSSEIALAAARRDAERRIALIQERAATELSEHQKKAQLALIGRMETTFTKRNEHIAKMAEHMEAAVSEMKLAQAANSAIMAAWPWQGTRDTEPTLCGLFSRLRSGLSYGAYLAIHSALVSNGLAPRIPRRSRT